jgi:8-oxo-dGTP diphosphatase
MKETAAVILFKRTEDGTRILLQHRSDDAPTFPDHFSPFGGSLEPGEDPEAAIRREVLEELCLYLSKVSLETTYDHFERGRAVKRTHLFISPLEESLQFLRVNQREGKGLGLFTFAEAAVLKMAAEDRALIVLARWRLG